MCGDSMDLVEGVPTGSVRVSLGYMSTLQDVQTFIGFIESCFVEKVVEVTDICKCVKASCILCICVCRRKLLLLPVLYWWGCLNNHCVT